jgi:hypothetical protein
VKRTPLKRKRGLVRRSSKARSFADELDAITPALLERAHYRCEACRTGPVEHRHHRLRRSQGGTNELGNLMALCNDCHEFIHRNPALAYEWGWLIRGNSGDVVSDVI